MSPSPNPISTPLRRTVPERIAACAAATPDAVALVDGNRHLTYGRLVRDARAFAHRLRALGVGAETSVAVAGERSAELVIAIAGVLEAGGAYVPLDPAHPAERHRFVLEDVEPRVVVGSAEALAALPPHDAAEVVLDGGRAVAVRAAAEAGAETVDAPPDPDRLMVVFYTSGSTGRAKGVAVTHGNVARLLAGWLAGADDGGQAGDRYVATGADEVFLLLAPTAFDASTLELWLPLTHGGRLVIHPPGPPSPFELGRTLARHGVTALWLTAGLFHQVVDADLGAFAPLRTLLAGGDVLSPERVRRVLDAHPGLTVVNGYGPTENTTFTCCGPLHESGDLKRSDPEGGHSQAGSVPIGRPIAGTRVEILDTSRLGAAGQPVPDGEEGELLAGGLGVTRGYVGRPALTAERYVPDASGREPGARLYRTGDRVCRLPDGRLDFRGRVDDQVKIRGFRIEPGEVAATLAAHPAVGEAVVVAVDGPGGQKRLLAYAVPAVAPASEAPVPDSRELRAFLAERLPEPMVPATVQLLDAFPLTANGKIDRRALPAPPAGRPDLSTAYRPPSGPVERELAAIFAELLLADREAGGDGAGPARVGADDSLYELGGHSLVATQVVTRVRRRFGRSLPLAAVFAHPTPAGLAAYLDGDDPADGAAVESVSAVASGAAVELPPIVRADRSRPIPLAFPQEQIWFLHRLAPDAIAYNFQFSLRLTGALDPAVLRRALCEIVRRHEILRTTFPADDGTPVQRIHEPWAVPLPMIDLSGLPADRREPACQRLIHRLVRRPFAFDRLPLFRGHLLRLAQREHLYLQVEHHFIHDGWSLAVYLGEIVALYEAFAAGRPSPLPELEIQFADFAAWQRNDLAAAVFPAQLDYWRQRMSRRVPPLTFETDRPRGRHQGFRGDRLHAELPARLYAETQAFSQRRGVTLFTTAYAVFAALGARVGGGGGSAGEPGELLVGSGAANRRLRELEPMLGMIVNTILLPADLSGDPTVGELLARVQDEVLGAQDHPDVPLEVLVADLQPDRDLSRNPLFQVLFSFHDSPVPDLELAGLSGEVTELHNGSAKADLNVVVKPRAEQRVGRDRGAEREAMTYFWEYDRDLYDRATIERLWRAYQTLLAGFLADPDRRVAELPLLDAAETRQVVRLGETPYLPGPTTSDGEREPIPLRVARRAAAAPDEPAVVATSSDGERTVTYGELVTSALSLAQRLESLRAAPEARVAVLLERSPELVVAQLATLFSGGAYVPLDPNQPAERLAAMVSGARPAVLVTRVDLVGRLLAGRLVDPAAGGPRVLLLDPLELIAEADPGTNAESQTATSPAVARLAGHAPHPEQLAYVIYTSGSTGRPKGVAVTHGGLANLVDWHLASYGVGPGDRVGLVAGLGFDASVWETWPTLASGACLYLPPEPVRADPSALVGWIAAAGVTVGFLPTPVAEHALGAEWPAEVALRTLLTGGDRLRSRPAADLPFTLVNHYGPTESTVVATAGRVVPSGGEEPAALPDIGRPIAGTRGYVLDAGGNPVPLGMPGELWLGGVGLARGYLGDPAQTAERFRPDPFSGDRGARLYGTGDRVRWRGGALDFLGRCDRQVSVRGLRVEPGEVEAALATHPGVRQVAVIARDGSALVAYWTPAPGVAEPDPDELRAYLTERVPGPMVPRWYVGLRELPLTANGKLDRDALPDPGPDRPATEHRPPEGPLEALVAEVWREVLDAGTVGRDDHFFALGGHSLTATQVVARLSALLDTEVPLTDVFDRPRLADLAAAIEARLLAEETGEDAPEGSGDGSGREPFGLSSEWQSGATG